MKSFRIILPVLFLVLVQPARAGSPSWNLNPSNGDWNTAANWTPATVPNSPTDVATFVISNTTDVSLSANVEVDSIIFDPGASLYTLSVGFPANLTLAGAGIVDNSEVEQLFVAFHEGTINFLNSATAGDAHLSVRHQSEVTFDDTATAGEAFIENHGGILPAITFFLGSSTAGNATIYNYASNPNGGGTLFMETSRAGTATVVSQGKGFGNAGVQFRDQSDGDHATLIAEGAPARGYPGHLVNFEYHSRAGRAIVIANGGTAPGAPGGSINIVDQANAENAILAANNGSNGGLAGQIFFSNDAQGGRARVELASGTLLRIDNRNAPGVSLGSLSGGGRVGLGAKNLTIGVNNMSTIFSGRIEDGNFGTVGSLTKLGAGVLTLTGDSTYTGGTIITDGALSVRNIVGSATGPGAVLVHAGQLSGDGIVAGAVTVGDGDAVAATISPGPSVAAPGTMTVQSSVTFNSDAIYQFNLQSDAGTASAMSASGVTIDNNALFAVHDTGSSTLAAGTSFLVISNTSANPIAGTFSNLADGAILTVGANHFQAGYEGGDGNDLTLTVVP